MIESFQEIKHPVDAVHYVKFAEMIGKPASAVKTMIDDNKLPIIPWRVPGGKSKKGENWVFLPEFNRAMRDAFDNRPKEQRDAWLLWLGL